MPYSGRIHVTVSDIGPTVSNWGIAKQDKKKHKKETDRCEGRLV